MGDSGLVSDSSAADVFIKEDVLQFFVGYFFADERLTSESGKGGSPHPRGIWQCFMWKGASLPALNQVQSHEDRQNFSKVIEQHVQERPAHSSLPLSCGLVYKLGRMKRDESVNWHSQGYSARTF